MEGLSSRRLCGCLIISCMSMMMGCAEWSPPPSESLSRMTTPIVSLSTDESFSVIRSGADSNKNSKAEQRSETVVLAAVDAPAKAESPAVGDAHKRGVPASSSAPRTQEERAVDYEFEDPFAQPGDQNVEVEEYDPWETFNVAIFNFNRKVDRYLLKPVATAYDFVVPDEIELGIRRMFYNVRFVPRMLNNLFQGKFKGAGIEMSRFLINSSLGLAGYLDFAKEVFGLETPPEDLGQTLGRYGIKPGRYLVLPIPPFVTTVRDLVGYVGDIFLDPFNYLVFPSIELNGAPSLIDHTHRTTTALAQLGTRTGDVVNERSINLESYAGVEESTVDLYGAVRNAYLQKRAQSIRE